MSKEKNNPSADLDPSDFASDPLNPLLVDLVLQQELLAASDIDDIDLEQLEDTLTEEDRKVLDSMGSAEQLLERIMSRQGMNLAADSTLNVAQALESPETTVEPGDTKDSNGPVDQEPAEGLEQMKRNVDLFANQKRFNFGFEYQKLEELGRGGQGIVHRLEGVDGFSAVRALKVFSPQSYKDGPSFIADMKRIRRIASSVHRNRHDDLVDIEWFGEHDGVYAMLMQYIDGFDLRRLLNPNLLPRLERCVDPDRRKTIINVVYSVKGTEQLALRPAIAVYIIERVLRGIEALHSKDIIHGDIKPSNIMLNASGSVKIIDIGSAFEVDSPPQEHYFTPAYVAPEFFETRTMSKQSDLASVGYMLIELLSGNSIAGAVQVPDDSTRTVGSSRSEELLKAKRSLPDRLGQILPEDVQESSRLVELCRRLIDPNLQQRFSSAADVIVDSKGTFEFSKNLIQSNLGVCNFQEIRQWLADAKLAI